MLTQDHLSRRQRKSNHQQLQRRGEKACEFITQTRLHKATAVILGSMLPSTLVGLLAEFGDTFAEIISKFWA